MPQAICDQPRSQLRGAGGSPAFPRRRAACSTRSLLCVMRSGPAAANDRRIRRFAFLPRLAAFRQDARGSARIPSAGGAAFAAAHRMAHRILRRAALMRLATHPPLAPGLAQADVHVVRVAQAADRRPTGGRLACLRSSTGTKRSLARYPRKPRYAQSHNGGETPGCEHMRKRGPGPT